jgi:hypothetical protein
MVVHNQTVAASSLRRWRVRTLAAAGIAGLSLCAGIPNGANVAHAGEGFFQKIGDGWKKGKWIPGIPNVRPQTVQEVLFPVCWGHPQDCRESAKPAGGPSQRVPEAWVSVSYRVDCRDRDTGADRADNTVTVTAPTRDQAVARIEELARTSDLCQANGDLSRITVPGSGRYLN